MHNFKDLQLKTLGTSQITKNILKLCLTKDSWLTRKKTLHCSC